MKIRNLRTEKVLKQWAQEKCFLWPIYTSDSSVSLFFLAHENLLSNIRVKHEKVKMHLKIKRVNEPELNFQFTSTY
jgi:hypothetical protein